MICFWSSKKARRSSRIPIKKAFSPSSAKKGSDLHGCATLIQWMRTHLLIVTLAFLLLVGVALGALAAGGASSVFLEKLSFLFHASVVKRSDNALGAVFIGSFASSFLFALSFLVCGMSVLGMVFIPCLVLFRGFGMGMVAGYLYFFYGWQGFFYYFLTILPGSFLCAAALLFAAQEAAKLSRTISQRKKPAYRLFFVRFGFVLCLLFFSSACDAIASFCFSDFFLF